MQARATRKHADVSIGSYRRVATAIVGCVVLLPAAAHAACPNEDALPDQISVSDYATTLLCAVNETRGAWGRPDVVLQGNLIRAANRFAADMVARHFFSHDSPDGETFADRLGAAGFIPSSDRWRWRAGENLAAGEGAEATPGAIVRAWINSADHRVNLLDWGFTMAGIGVARGWPASDARSDAITVVLDLGYRRRVGSPAKGR
jgi:uncharacterized protein YkwD